MLWFAIAFANKTASDALPLLLAMRGMVGWLLILLLKLMTSAHQLVLWVLLASQFAERVTLYSLVSPLFPCQKCSTALATVAILFNREIHKVCMSCVESEWQDGSRKCPCCDHTAVEIALLDRSGDNRTRFDMLQDRLHGPRAEEAEATASINPCAVCLGPLQRPVVLAHSSTLSHTVCFPCIQQYWIDGDRVGRCPACRQNVDCVTRALNDVFEEKGISPASGEAQYYLQGILVPSDTEQRLRRQVDELTQQLHDKSRQLQASGQESTELRCAMEELFCQNEELSNESATEKREREAAVRRHRNLVRDVILFLKLMVLGWVALLAFLVLLVVIRSVTRN